MIAMAYSKRCFGSLGRDDHRQGILAHVEEAGEHSLTCWITNIIHSYHTKPQNTQTCGGQTANPRNFLLQKGCRGPMLTCSASFVAEYPYFKIKPPRFLGMSKEAFVVETSEQDSNLQQVQALSSYQQKMDVLVDRYSRNYTKHVHGISKITLASGNAFLSTSTKLNFFSGI